MPVSARRSILLILLAVGWTSFLAAQNSDGLQSILVDDVATPVEPIPVDPPGTVAPANFQLPVDDVIQNQPEVAAEAEALEELPEALPSPPPLPVPDRAKPNPSLERRGPVDRSEARSHALGISTAGVDAGLKIVGLIVGGPAAQAGLRLGDVIQTINGMTVRSPRELAQFADTKSDEAVQLDIVRDGQLMTATVQVGANVTASHRAPATQSGYRRRVTVRAPGVRIDTEAGIGTSSARVTVTAPPILAPRSVRRAIRLSAPPIPPIGPRFGPPIGPRIGPRFGPPIGPPPRFFRPSRFGW